MTYQIRKFDQEDLQASSQLTAAAFAAGWFPVDWHWRYLQYPTTVDKWVIEVDGAVIGFYSAVQRQIRLGPDVVVESVVLGDLVIDPSARGLGYGKQAVADLARITVDSHPEAKVALFWARRELADAIYDPVIGVAHPPSSTIRYTYQRSWDRTIERLHALPSLPQAPIRFEVAGRPSLVVGPDRAEVTNTHRGNRGATIRLRTRAIGSFRGSPLRRRVKVTIALLRGDIRPIGFDSWRTMLLQWRSAMATTLTILRS